MVGQRKDPVDKTTSHKLVTARVSVDNTDAFIDASAVNPVLPFRIWFSLNDTPQTPQAHPLHFYQSMLSNREGGACVGDGETRRTAT
ncbi:MAG: hypothetical protein WB755_01565, partial [Terriglobales bacterium]